jgi:hypothetical protein
VNQPARFRRRKKEKQMPSGYEIVRDSLVGRISDGPLHWWSNRLGSGQTRSDAVSGEKLVRDCVAALEASIKRLGQRHGSRADKARAFLCGERDRLAAKLATFESVQLDLSGPTAVALIAKIDAAVAAFANATRLVDQASREDVLRLRDEALLARADLNAAQRELAELSERLTFPSVPRVDAAVERAKVETEALVAMMRADNARARTIHLACEQGAAADQLTAHLHVVFEAKSHEAFELRALRFAEAQS